jgi:hypothetical protein
MGAARTALLGLVGALAAAVDPETVAIDDDAGPPPEGGPAVRVHPTSLARVGRSRRDGAVLDLELVAAVRSDGPEALELTEQMLTALERESRYTAEPVSLPTQASSRSGMVFQVRMPVPVRLDEPVPPRVTEPIRLDVRLVRSLSGVLIDSAGHGVADAQVSASVGSGPSVTDPDGRFRLLVADAPRQTLVVEVRGATRTVDAATDTAPVVIRWE